MFTPAGRLTPPCNRHQPQQHQHVSIREETLQHKEMAYTATSPALTGWEGPAGREEAGRRGNNTYPTSRKEQPYRVIHGEGEDVEQLIWFITPEAHEEGNTALPHLHPHAMYQRLAWGS